MCGTWTDHDGVVRLLVDGDCKLVSNQTIHGLIPGTGKLILGQHQDIMGLGGAFDLQQRFVGEISYLYIWNIDLGNSVIFSLSMHCKEHPEYIVERSDFMQGIHGNIARRNNSWVFSTQHQHILNTMIH